MPEFFTSREVKEKPFLFVSYSHNNKEITDKMARFLLDEGVRLWYDKDLVPGDAWSEKVIELIEHPNCGGVVFVCSPSAFLSENVHKEREAALKVQEKKTSEEFPFFLVNVCEDEAHGSYMSLLKQTFDKLSSDTIDKELPINRFSTLMRILGRDMLGVKTADENCFSQLLRGISEKASAVVDKGAAVMENLQRRSGIGGLTFTLGNYNGSLKWQMVSLQGKNGVFLLQRVLEPDFGKGLDNWLNSAFRSMAFSEEEAQLLQEDIRLLTIKETEALARKDLQADVAWWLQDCTGSRQAEVSANGTVSALRQLNQRFKRGVRPVITIKMEDVDRLTDND